MGKSLQRKSFDVPATTISARQISADAETSTAQNDDYSGAAMLDEPTFEGDELENDFAYELEADFVDEFDSLIGEEMFEDYWEDELEQNGKEPYRDYADDEFELGPSKDPMADLFAEEHPAQSNHYSTVRNTLERGMIRALTARSSETFLKDVVRSLNEALTVLQPDQTDSTRRHSHSPSKQKSASSQQKVAKQNGHQPTLKRQVAVQPLVERLTYLRTLVQRYAKRGLQEWDVLEDVIALWSNRTQADVMTPILTGLAARLALIPLEGANQSLSSSLRKKLFSAIHRATALLNQNHALSALPGLAINVGQHAAQLDRPLTKLPQDFHQAATRVIDNPSLQQRLANFKFETSTRGAIAPHQLPRTLRINGPIEILLRRPQGQ